MSEPRDPDAHDVDRVEDLASSGEVDDAGDVASSWDAASSGDVAGMVLGAVESALPGPDEADLIEGRGEEDPEEVPPQALHNPWWVPL